MPLLHLFALFAGRRPCPLVFWLMSAFFNSPLRINTNKCGVRREGEGRVARKHKHIHKGLPSRPELHTTHCNQQYRVRFLGPCGKRGKKKKHNKAAEPLSIERSEGAFHSRPKGAKGTCDLLPLLTRRGSLAAGKRLAPALTSYLMSPGSSVPGRSHSRRGCP